MAQFDSSRWDDSPILKPRSTRVMGLKAPLAALIRARACGSCKSSKRLLLHFERPFLKHCLGMSAQHVAECAAIYEQSPPDFCSNELACGSSRGEHVRTAKRRIRFVSSCAAQNRYRFSEGVLYQCYVLSHSLQP